MSRLLSFVAGAVTVGIVVAVLAIAGVIDNGDGSGAPTRAQTTPTPAPATRSANGVDVATIYDRVSPGVVFVQDHSGRGQLPFPGGGQAASGSGFVIDDDGHIVTNDHV